MQKVGCAGMLLIPCAGVGPGYGWATGGPE